MRLLRSMYLIILSVVCYPWCRPWLACEHVMASCSLWMRHMLRLCAGTEVLVQQRLSVFLIRLVLCMPLVHS